MEVLPREDVGEVITGIGRPRYWFFGDDESPIGKTGQEQERESAG